ncbi:MAG: penicillin acylase family protein [Acidobacteria bacterium]|nr:penicillin acylase family protein [Acidobacteriota bacterium]
MQKIVRDINLVIGALLIAFLAIVYWYAWSPLPAVSGTVRLPVDKPATVVRDELGAPHITAAGVEDAVFLQGYVHAQDRLFQMDALRRFAAGELAEVAGSAALQTDQESRRLRMRRLAEMHYARLSAEDRRMMGAYARGVNHFLETHAGKLPVEFSLLGYDPRPWSVIDTLLVGLQMYRSLTSNWKDELLKGTLLENAAAKNADPGKVQFLFPVRTGEEAQLGSNAWVISGKHTASGKPILANDTHLEWAFPSPWYLVHLKADGWNVSGFSLPGVPLVIVGHNERIAWGITNLQFDVQDIYMEQLNPATGQYLYDGKVQLARQEREVIRVKGGNTVELNLWVTRHGPVFVSSDKAQLALHWVAAEPEGFAFPFPLINRASNWEQFSAALEKYTGPGSNFVYADVDGNIGYRAAGRLPLRRNHNGDVPVPGNDPRFEWDGFIPFADMPSSYNPPSGILVTSNQNPFPEKSGYRVNGNFASHYRSRQVLARLQSHEGWKAEEMPGIQMDAYSGFSHRLARDLVNAWEKRGQANKPLAPAVDLLRKWDGQMRRGLAAPFLVTLAFQHLRKAVAERASPTQGSTYEAQMAPVVIERLLDTRPADWFKDFDALLMQCFSDAVDEGKKLQGDSIGRWDYGKYTEFTLSHPVISKLPVFGSWFNLGPMPMDGSSSTVKQTTRRLGPSMRFVADLANWDASLRALTTGQSGQPLSKHFRDQWEAYYAGRVFAEQFHKVNAMETLTVEPGR